MIPLEAILSDSLAQGVIKLYNRASKALVDLVLKVTFRIITLIRPKLRNNECLLYEIALLVKNTREFTIERQ